MITADRGTRLYPELLKKVLTNVIHQDPPLPNEFTQPGGYDQETQAYGRDRPMVAHTMVGTRRRGNVHQCLGAGSGRRRLHRDTEPGAVLATRVTVTCYQTDVLPDSGE
jgi:hypothetical protein